ncbi:MAG TPA: leucyl/phenylalanyl-tRNA--protein transferase [Anaerolineae bacterium]|nr:leucyl/phenylalanyl-tRNA--protein transferase [Anaerolineae bacterium]
MLLNAYAQGIFPMAHDDGEIYWYDPDPRAILPLDKFYVSRSLARTVRQEKFEVKVNGDFRGTMLGCADREETWIDEQILAAYTGLNRHGFAHSVECWQDGELVGGLYGVALRGLFAGESMFSYRRDASKVALVHLVERLRERGFVLLDVQFPTEHLRRFGVITIPRAAYKAKLARAMMVEAVFAP